MVGDILMRWILIILLVLLFIAAYIWAYRPRWCLWQWLQWQTNKHYTVWYDGFDRLPQKSCIAICDRPTVLMAVLLRGMTSLPITCLLSEVPHYPLGLARLLKRNHIAVTTSLDTVNIKTAGMVIMSCTDFDVLASKLSDRVIFLHLCGESRHNIRHNSKRHWLQLSCQLPDLPSSQTLTRQWQHFSLACWQSYIPKLPSFMEMWLRQVKAGSHELAVVDSMGTKLSRCKLLVGVKSMRDYLYPMLQNQTRVAICLPPSAAGNVAILACFALGKTIIPLNYTAEIDTLQYVLQTTSVTTIITAKIFISNLQKKGFDITPILKGINVIYLDEVKSKLKKTTLLKNMLITRFASARRLTQRILTPVKMDDIAVILFSSGSEGRPKGVMLTHANLIGNIKQMGTVVNIVTDGAILAVLPTFHAFGLTVTTLMPLLEGILQVCHPDPRDAATIGTLVQQYQVTIMCGTSTFYRLYVRNRSLRPEMFASLQFVFAGGEKLQPEVRILFEEKFGKTVYEAYGTTELSPAASCNQPDTAKEICHEQGTIGRALPGCLFCIFDPATHVELPIGEAGMIAVAGVNVMQGYLNDAKKTQSILLERDHMCWYLTGDKGKIDARGFVTILDRYSRFAKLGGEMVSLGALEKQVNDLICQPDIDILAVAVPDEQKGEVVVLLIAGAVKAQQIRDQVMSSDMYNLIKPKHYFKVPAIPILGSGKNDFAQAKKLAISLLNNMR